MTTLALRRGGLRAAVRTVVRTSVFASVMLAIAGSGWLATVSQADESTPEAIVEQIALPAEEPLPTPTEPVVVDTPTPDTSETVEQAPTPTPADETGSTPAANDPIQTPDETDGEETPEPTATPNVPSLDAVAVTLTNQTAFGPRGSTVTFDYVIENGNDMTVVLELELLVTDPSWPVWIGDPAAESILVIEPNSSVNLSVYMTIPANVSLLARNQVSLDVVAIDAAA